MPKRIIKPAWEHIKSPITLKSGLLFLTISFIAYTVVRDYQQSQASFERFKVIAKYTEESRVALENAKHQNQLTDEATQNTIQMLTYMASINTSMQEMAELLRINRERQRSEHELILNGTGPTKRKGKHIRLPGDCYELRPTKKQYGNTEVTINEYVKIPCT